MASAANGTRIFVGNLPTAQPTQAITAFFGVCGTIESADLEEGRPHGWITYDTAESAQKAINELNGAEFTGSAVRVEAARPPRAKQPRPEGDAPEGKPVPTNVFVGNLPRRMDDADAKLREVFGSCGAIVKTRYNSYRGNGYVNFETADAAQAALGKADTDIGGRPARVEIELRRPRRRTSSKKRAAAPAAGGAAKKAGGAKKARKPAAAIPTRIFVGRLPEGTEEEAVRGLVAPYGTVAKVLRRRNNMFVDFETAEQAAAAVAGLQGATMGDAELRVEAHKPAPAPAAGGASPAKKAKAPRAPRERNTTPPDARIVWVGGINPEITQENVAAAVSGFGPVERVEMHPRYAFVTFNDEAAAKACVEGLEGQAIEGETVNCALSLRRPPRPNPLRIFVANFPEGVTEDDLRDFFGAAGNITQLSISRTGTSGYISFETEEAQQEAIKRFAGADMRGSDLRVEAALPRRPRRRNAAEAN